MTIYQHFRQEEHDFIDKVVDWKQSVEDQYSPKLTDFLDPREQEIVKTIIGEHTEVKVKLFGGNALAERRRALIYPSYLDPSDEDFQLEAYEISYPSKFTKLEHRQILGTLMSLGLKRSKFGDILFQDDIIQMIVTKEVGNYIEMNFNEVGKVSISLKNIKVQDTIVNIEDWEQFTTTVSSLRLDSIVAAIYNISRQKAKLLVEGSKIKVNWKLVEQASFECREGDVVSVRGFGRSKLISLEGKTKKDKWKIIFGKQK